MPLVIAFHGKNNQNYVFREQTQLSDPKWNNEAAVAFPKAIDLQWTGDPTSPPLAEINDIEFAGQLIDHITQMYCVDLRRVYAVGFSNGGGLTQLLACDRTLSSRLAAAAIVSGAFYLDYALKDPLFSHCTPARSPFPIMEFHGNEDPIIHYNGKATPDGQTFDIANWGPAWAQRNGCSADQVAVPLVTQQSQFAVYSWNCGSAKDSVSHHQIEGLGHAWPSRRKQNDDSLGLGATTFDATPAIIDFFRGHTLPDITKAFKDEL